MATMAVIRSWSMPPDPGPEVTRVKDKERRTWVRDRDGWRIPGDGTLSKYAWSSLLMLAGPLTDATPAKIVEEE